ncbi:peptide-methionine (S)-S-oxide reductase MsrA [Sphingobium sp. CAP-1]|uniref:peptide-methionine (S)-S-oxide reductase MsrA n=1 Tax=Sphingobium sp. CAP-1 TaxID=2676077 RepID=UPI0012BB4442|nr:peptide-methionine (S)-S-oxide reductase MsrA [Sphingobium sp. CAP-1]QGP80046.1 peptide-methionine (S)-S-oxide reductase MsrA [Sphingobium sp. CAP-1]
MARRSKPFLLAFLAALAAASPLYAEGTVPAPVPATDAVPTRKLETAIFAGGCYWGVEGVFSHVKGVHLAVSGFAGGPGDRRVDYETVSNGDTGFAESVRVTYDPAIVSYGTLLRIFFSVIADPTTLNYQRPDSGTQYRSALFPLNAEQDRVAHAYLAQLGRSGLWRDPIVTRVERFTGFQDAAADHQDFLRKNPWHPYILRWDKPKIAALKAMFPTLYREKPSA